MTAKNNLGNSYLKQKLGKSVYERPEGWKVWKNKKNSSFQHQIQNVLFHFQFTVLIIQSIAK